MPSLFFAGEVFIALFAIFIVIAMPVIVIGIIFFVLNRNSKNRAAWQKLSSSVGMTMPNPKRLEMIGDYDGTAVRLAVGARSSGGENRHTEFFTYCTSSFPESLLLNLNIESDGGFFSRAFRSGDICIGSENFDEAFNCVCYDANVLKSLLSTDFPSNKTQNLMGDLMLASRSFTIIKITDEQIYIESAGQIGSEEVLRNKLETVSSLAKRFYTARRRLPPAGWEITLENSWGDFARERNLNFSPSAKTVEGVCAGFPLKIFLKTQSQKWQTVFEIRFVRSLQIGLKIMPENAVHKALTWVGAQDIEVGIPEFDNAFIVKADNAQAAKMKLQPDICRHLVLLFKDASAFSVDDNSLSFTLDTVIGEPEKLRGFTSAAVAAVQMLSR